MKTRLLLALLGCVGAFALSADGADWPQWRGPDRTNVSTETGLLKTWPKDGPPLLWTFTDGGIGYSGPAIVGDRLYCMGGRGDSDYVYALDLKQNGKELWAAKVGPVFKGNEWNAGPSATPAVDGKLVFALSSLGELVCVEAAGGKEVWRKNLPKELDASVNPIGGGPANLGWGFAWSPLLDGDQLVCVPGGTGGTLAALDKKTGKVIWRSKELTDEATYSSPIAIEVGGVRQYVEMTNQGVAGVAAKDGKLLWYYKRKPPYGDVVIPTPLYHDGYVYTTFGHGASAAAGCDLVKLSPAGSGFKADQVYPKKSQRNMKNKQGGVVRVGDHVYGYSSRDWVCQEFKTGNIVWEENKLGSGSVTAADGHLYCLTENDGTVALVEATPAGWKQTGEFKLPRESKLRKPSGKIWTPPVIANGRLYLRDQDLIFCYDIKEKK
jgi:outer membrane protein assembly factor BamB